MKKRSLFVATAMLLVAVLVATGATYAWFTGLSTASTTIEMGVANGDSLEISVDNATWKTALTEADFDSLDGKTWTDLSTINAELGTFYDETYDATQTTTINGYQVAAGKVASCTVYFRASKAGIVELQNGTLSGVEGTLLKALRVGVDGDANNIMAQEATTINDAIQASDLTDGDAVGSGEQVATAFGTATQIVTLTASGEYYTGSAIFYFWVEGTEAENKDTKEGLKAKAAMTFALAQ